MYYIAIYTFSYCWRRYLFRKNNRLNGFDMKGSSVSLWIKKMKHARRKLFSGFDISSIQPHWKKTHSQSERLASLDIMETLKSPFHKSPLKPKIQ